MLCAVMLLGVLSACTTLEEGDKGMVINVYIATELFDFDPARHFNDDAMVKIYDLVYEGLTDLDENGKWKKVVVYKYKPKTGYHKKNGHRQQYTAVKITKINA